MKSERLKAASADMAVFLLAGVLYSAAVNCFTAPNNIAPGGVTGIATLINYLLGVGVGSVSILINIPLIILSFVKLGKKFTIKTAEATVVMFAEVDLIAPLLPVYSGDRMLASIFGGLLMGAGVALIFLRGATSGGIDIAARVVQRRFPHISIGRLILAADVLVAIFAAAVYGDVESALYAVTTSFAASKVIDAAIYGAHNGKLITAVTVRGENIAKRITDTGARGVTIIKAVGAYTGEEKEFIVCAVRPNEAHRFKAIIFDEDPGAFLIVSEINEVVGEGFSSSGEASGPTL